MFLNCSHYSVLIPMFWDFSPWWDAWWDATVFLDWCLNQWQANSSLACLSQGMHNLFRLMCFWLLSRPVRWASRLILRHHCQSGFWSYLSTVQKQQLQALNPTHTHTYMHIYKNCHDNIQLHVDYLYLHVNSFLWLRTFALELSKLSAFFQSISVVWISSHFLPLSI